MVPVETIGEAEGVKTEGGVLEHVLFKVKARALPKDLPEVITVDVSHLKIGQAIHLGELTVPANVELVGDKGIPVIAIAAPRTEEEEAAEAAAAAEAVPGEVEMIKEKKEEGEEGAPPAKGAEKGAVKGAEKAPAKGAEKAAPGTEKAAPGADKKAVPAAADKKAAPAAGKKK
jgi:large subunit ribosomal protein L25